MTVGDYFRIEEIMEAWYDAGKLEATGALTAVPVSELQSGSPAITD